MQIKTRLTFLFTSLIGALLLVFAISIYFTSAQIREDEYYKKLQQQATTKANLLFDTKVPPKVLQLIYKNTADGLFQEEVAIYDSSFNLRYHDAVEIDKVKESRQMINAIIAKKEMKFYVGDLQVVGFVFKYEGKTYVITAAAIDNYGLSKLNHLQNTLLLTLLIAVVAIFFISRFLAKKALQPVLLLVEKVKKITATNLDLRVDEGNRKDEIAALAVTFNEMLNRLESSFDAQKHFVSNISHELRTPLTTMLAEMQLTIQKERTNAEYIASIQHIIGDTKKLIRLSNSLLDLAKANYDQTEIAFKTLRLDEVILDAHNDTLHNQPTSKVDIIFEKEIDNDQVISVKGNEYLLKVAFTNLMENGCKFSNNKQSTTAISYNERDIILKFSDNGIGIAEQDIPNIFTPFYRGANKTFADGNGIGLFLTQKIIALHNGTITVVTKPNQGTCFTIQLPHLILPL